MREEGRERSLPTIFIDNIHFQTTKGEILEIFKGRQRIVDVFISTKRRINTKFLFGFVRVERQEDIETICRRCNGRVHRGIKLYVKPARFNHPALNQTKERPLMGNKPINVRDRLSFPINRPAFRDHRSFKQALERNNVNGNKEHHSCQQTMEVAGCGNRKTIFLDKCVENMEWLKRSCVLLCPKPMGRDLVDNLLISAGFAHQTVTDMGTHQLLITFQNENDMKVFLDNHKGKFNDSFSEAKPWSSSDCCETRRVWLDLMGLPLHLWSEENIKKIAETCGKVVKVADASAQKISFGKASVLVDTLCLETISGKFSIQTEDEEFHIFIREGPVESQSQLVGNFSVQALNKEGLEDEESVVQQEQFPSHAVPETIMTNGESQGDLAAPKKVNIEICTEVAVENLNTSQEEQAQFRQGPKKGVWTDPSTRVNISTDLQHQFELKGPIPVSNTNPSKLSSSSESVPVSLASDSSLPPGFENHIQPEISPDEVLRFALKLGLDIEGKEEETKARIATLLEEEKAVIDYFKQLFVEDYPDRPIFRDVPFNTLSHDEATWLIREVEEKEIEQAVADCDGSRAPGPDGFNFNFIKSNWKIIKQDIVAFVQQFWNSGYLPCNLNTAYITLIPKVPGANELKNFRPISMVGCLYKIISKILASRLKHVMSSLIGVSQSSFVEGRKIIDSVLIANEIIHSVKHRRDEAVILKIDFHKAFDSVSWSFLDWTLKGMGFPVRWRNWMRTCVSSASMAILVNGSPTEPFKLHRGLRQGDPLSPFLFNLVVEVLSRLISKANGMQLTEGLSVGSGAETIITHLFLSSTPEWRLRHQKHLFSNPRQLAY